MSFLVTIILDFFVAFGVLIGGCLLGGLGAIIIAQPTHPPLDLMSHLADKIKIWAVVAAIGGTIDTLSAIERGFFSGSHGEVVKHLLFICSAFLGAHAGTIIIKWFVGEY
ncbi:YtrH family sporulation protein [Caldalkalibacillus salinus]|uniref:YtrH family sporulation protein n=1 Tax=Caldalkalibacillus salinus TaxID=2803787 RepID=UPI00301AB471